LRLRFFVASFLLVALTTCPTGHVYCSTELIRNGGFDEGINYWSRPGTEAAVSDAYAHAGRYSLRVANSSAWQNIQLEGASSVDLNLSFWVYLFNPAAISGKTVAAITVSLITPTATGDYLTMSLRAKVKKQMSQP